MSDFPERNISGLTIKIDRTTCIGTANCIKVAPDVFELDNGKICSFKENTPDIEKEILVESCSVCPVNALYVIDNKGNQIIP
jgi:ferredoxin